MANYETITRLRPSFSDYKVGKDVFHRGDTLFFPRHHRSPFFSTDGQGFRHTISGQETLTVAQILQRERYGLVIGGSRVFGFGLDHNQRTIPSLFSEQFGFPFANVSLPHASTRNIASLLLAYFTRAPRLPAAVVLITSGDFTNFCYSSIADPVFGSPNPKMLRMVLEEKGGIPDAAASLPALLAFTTLWTRSIAQLCRSRQVPLVLFHDTSFFEKRTPDAWDVECELGTAFVPADARWHATHKAFVGQYLDRREAIARKLEIPLVGEGRVNDLTFIDEFHYDEPGAEAVANDIALTLQTLL